MAVAWDHEHIASFARFLRRRFVEDKCFETAGALSYTTLFALVPLMASVIGILSAFPMFSDWTGQLVDFIFRNFVPATGMTVRDYLLGFVGNANKMTAIGIVVLLVSALMMMWAIEDRLNRIWRVDKHRSSVSRFLLYWAALSLGPILVVASIAASSYVLALPWLAGAAAQFGIGHLFLRLLPFLVTFVSLLLLYVLVPNRRVAPRQAAVGAFLAATLFELSRFGFAAYVGNVASYQQIYGALAAIPIFLVWVYLSWVIVLLGASIAASLSSFDYRPVAERLPAGAEFLGLLHVLRYFVEAQRTGALVAPDAIYRNEKFVSEDLLQRYIADLQGAGMIEQTGKGSWVLVRSPDSTGLVRVYESGRYHLPLDSGLVERWCSGLPAGLQALLGDTIEELVGRLDTRLDRLYPDQTANGDAPVDGHQPDEKTESAT